MCVRVPAFPQLGRSVPASLRSHWTRYVALGRKRAGRRARRLVLAHGLWDPAVPVPVDPSSTAFYYPGDGGDDDPTLLSSEEEGEEGGGKGAVTAAIREEASGGDDSSEFVMADGGSEVLLVAPRVVRTPMKSAAVYANALTTALTLGPGVAFVTEPTNSVSQPLGERFRVSSSNAPRRAKATPRVEAAAAAADDALLALPLSPSRPPPSRPLDAAVVQTGFETDAHVDSMYRRRLAALQRRVSAMDVPVLPPNMGALQRTSQRQGPVCAHALRVASGAVHSDSEEEEEGVVAREAAVVEAALKGEPVPAGRLRVNGLADLIPNPEVLSVVEAATRAGEEEAAAPRPHTAGARKSTASKKTGSGSEVSDKGMPPPGDDSLHFAYSPDVGDGSGYRGAGVGSFLTSRKGWLAGGMGLVHAAVPAGMVHDIEDSATWGSRPRGLLVATCKSHAGPVTDVVTSQDHTFFVSGSSDGTIALWLSRNLNKCGCVCV